MSFTVGQKKMKAETLAWITDDEAEFWTVELILFFGSDL
jgi:hypothetical protein